MLTACSLCRLPLSSLHPRRSRSRSSRVPARPLRRHASARWTGIAMAWLTRAEWRGSDRSFESHDWNRDGILSGDEVREARSRHSIGAVRTAASETTGKTPSRPRRHRNNQIERHEWHASSDAFDGSIEIKTAFSIVARSSARRGAWCPAGAARAPIAAPQVQLAATGDCVDNARALLTTFSSRCSNARPIRRARDSRKRLFPGKTVRDIVAQLAKSQEHATRYFWQPITMSLYQQILRREPSQQELQQTSADLASGQRQLIDVIGRTARRAANSDEEAVKILYRRLLGREADEAGLRGFTEQAGRQGIESVARDLVASAEYRQRSGGANVTIDNGAYESAVRTLYRHVLGRDADQSALQPLVRAAASSGFERSSTRSFRRRSTRGCMEPTSFPDAARVIAELRGSPVRSRS